MSIKRVVYDYNEDQKIKAWEEAYEACKRLRRTSIIYRGFHKTSGHRSEGGFFKVVEDREGFKGAHDPNVKVFTEALMSKWSFKSPQPTFATFDKSKAKFFGDVHILIPLAPFISLQSKEVDDILVYMSKYDKVHASGGTSQGVAPEEDIKALANTYERTLSDRIASEVIFDCKDYYLLALPERWFNQWLPRKWHTTSDQLTDYSQLTDLLGKVLWLKKKQKQERDNMKNTANEARGFTMTDLRKKAIAILRSLGVTSATEEQIKDTVNKLTDIITANKTGVVLTEESTITAKDFTEFVEDEFDVEILQLMRQVIDKRVEFLDKMADMAKGGRTVVKGFQSSASKKQDLLKVVREDCLDRSTINMLHEVATQYGVKDVDKHEWKSVTNLATHVCKQLDKSKRASFIADLNTIKEALNIEEYVVSL